MRRYFRAALACLLTTAGCGSTALVSEQARQVPPEIASHTVRVGDVNIHYRSVGNGEPLVLLHGFTQTSRAWDPFVAALSEDFRLIMTDMRGHGGSDNPTGQFTHRLAAQDVLGLMDTLRIDRFKGAGHSSGAVALLEAAAIAPDRVEAIILVNGAHRFTEAAKADMLNANADEFKATYPKLYEAVVEWHPGRERQFRDLQRQIPQLAQVPPEQVLTTDDLSAVTTRTLVAFGDRDDINPVELAVELYRALPNAELWVMPNTWHNAMFAWEFLEEGFCPGCEAVAKVFPQVIRDFFKERTP